MLVGTTINIADNNALSQGDELSRVCRLGGGFFPGGFCLFTAVLCNLTQSQAHKLGNGRTSFANVGRAISQATLMWKTIPNKHLIQTICPATNSNYLVLSFMCRSLLTQFCYALQVDKIWNAIGLLQESNYTQQEIFLDHWSPKQKFCANSVICWGI